MSGNFERGQTLFRSAKTCVFRALDRNSGAQVIVKSLTIENPSPGEVSKFYQEYNTLNGLSDLRSEDGILAPIRKELFEGSHAIVFPDVAGQPVASHIEQYPSIDCFYEMALLLTKTLGMIHSRGLIHKDLNPSNFLTSSDLKRFWIIDFSLATQVSRELQLVLPVNALEGTLHYLAPEQSGRLNRHLDYRADYYSLGISFFEILTGRKPFHSLDIMELLHAHMTEQLPDPANLRAEIPKSLVAIIQKLASKDPDDRYQSALGIITDLEESRDAWKRGDSERVFRLGQADFSERLIIPSKIFGREEEIEALLASFEKCRAGGGLGQFVLISGASGIGKSAVVRELLRPVSESGGYFLEGKFEQYQRSIPLYALRSALLSLFDLLAGDSGDHLNQIKHELDKTLRSNVGVITDFIPELSLYLGTFEKPHLLGPEETRNRMLDSFSQFLQVVAKRKPLVLFMDDLQWGDRSTLDLLERLSHARTPGLLLVAAYRPNEVSQGHPLQVLLEKISGNFEELPVRDLEALSVDQFLKETLGASPSVPAVAALILKKTGGNPLFMHQFFRQIYRDGLLVRDAAHHCWEVDLSKLENLEISPNVVEFLVQKIKKLKPRTQELLSLGAAQGAKFETELDPTYFAEGIQEEFIRPIGQNRYQFAHDRIQQACYELMDPAKKAKTHLALAQLLFEKNANPIEIAEHFNRAELSSPDDEIRLKMTASHLSAAELAEDSGQIVKAQEFAEKARSLLNESLSVEARDLCRRVLFKSAFLAMLTEQTDRAKQICEQLLQDSKSNSEKAQVYSMISEQFVVQWDLDQGIEYALKVLQILGFPIKRQPSIFTVLSNIALTFWAIRKIRSTGKRMLPVLDLPVIQDPDAALVQKTLKRVFFEGLKIGKLNLGITALMLGSRLALTKGLAPSSIAILSMLPTLFVEMGLYRLVQEFLELGKRLVLHPASTDKGETGAGLIGISFTGLLCQSSASLLEEALRGFEYGLEYRSYEASSLSVQITELMGQTARLSDLLSLGLIEKIEAVGDKGSSPTVKVVLSLYEGLAFDSPYPFSLVKARLEELENLSLAQKDQGRIGMIYGVRIVLFFLFSSIEEYIPLLSEFLEKAKSMPLRKLLGRTPLFFAALGSLKWQRVSKKPLPLKIKRNLQSYRKMVKELSSYNEMVFSYRHFFIEAEVARNEGLAPSQVMKLFRKSMDAARADGNLFFEALAAEHAGEYQLDQGNSEFGLSYLQKAYRIYKNWGANSRLRYLEGEYPELLQAIANQGQRESRTVSISASGSGSASSQSSRAGDAGEGTLDFYEVLKAARSLSSEVVLTKLTEKLLKTASEVSGAELALLFLPDKKEMALSLYSGVNKDSKPTDPKVQAYPTHLLERVRLKKEPIFIGDASKDSQLYQDPYFKNRKVRSVACVPTLNQGQLSSVLYLENNAVAGAFTETRIKTLDLIASQAAVSIENVRLYETLEDKVRERTRDIQAILRNLQQGVFTIETSMAIHPEYSPHLETILEVQHLAGKNPVSMLFDRSSIGSNRRGEIEAALNTSLGNSLMNFEFNAHLLPSEFTRQTLDGKEQLLELDWKAIEDSEDRIQKILVTLRDVSELRRLQTEAKEQKEELEMIGQILACGAPVFKQAFDRAIEYLGECRRILECEIHPDERANLAEQLFRNLHTVKGNARTLRLSYAVDSLHEAEQYLATLRGKSSQYWDIPRILADIKQCEEALARYNTILAKKLRSGFGSGKGHAGVGEAERNALETLRQGSILKLSDQEQHQLIEDLHFSLSYLPLADILKAELNSLKDLAASLKKECPEIQIDSDYLFSLHQVPLLKDVFTHCFRNSLDHGIEAAEKRIQSGKPKSGTISIQLIPPLNHLSCGKLVFSDDGRGLDLGAIHKKGVQAGTCGPGASDEEVAELIFRSGVSTADHVTDISGRGVGMDAVRALFEKEGGRVTLEFTGPKSPENFRPFQLVFSLPLLWKLRKNRNSAAGYSSPASTVPAAA